MRSGAPARGAAPSPRRNAPPREPRSVARGWLSPLPTLLLLAAVDLAGLVAGAWLLFGSPRRRRARPWMDVGMLVGLGVALGLATGVRGFAERQPFLVLRLWCHVLFCVLAPLLVVRGLARRDAAGWAFLVVGLAAEGTYLWARRVEPFRLEVTRHRVESARLTDRATPLRVVVLADLQTDSIGSFEAEVFAAMDRERPDLLLVP